jgi:hypothetical protein
MTAKSSSHADTQDPRSEPQMQPFPRGYVLRQCGAAM